MMVIIKACQQYTLPYFFSPSIPISHQGMPTAHTSLLLLAIRPYQSSRHTNGTHFLTLSRHPPLSVIKVCQQYTLPYSFSTSTPISHQGMPTVHTSLLFLAIRPYQSSRHPNSTHFLTLSRYPSLSVIKASQQHTLPYSYSPSVPISHQGIPTVHTSLLFLAIRPYQSSRHPNSTHFLTLTRHPSLSFIKACQHYALPYLFSLSIPISHQGIPTAHTSLLFLAIRPYQSSRVPTAHTSLLFLAIRPYQSSRHPNSTHFLTLSRYPSLSVIKACHRHTLPYFFLPSTPISHQGIPTVQRIFFWAHPYFSSNSKHVLLIVLGKFAKWEVKLTVEVLFCWVLLPGFLQNSTQYSCVDLLKLFFFPDVPLQPKSCIHRVVLPRLLLELIPDLFYQREAGKTPTNHN